MISKFHTLCSCVICKIQITPQNLNAHYNKHLKPIKYCLHCGKVLTSRYAKQFCNTSCATSYNNIQRTQEARDKQHETLMSTLDKKLDPDRNLRNCVICSTQFTTNSHYRRITCSGKCLKQLNPFKQDIDFVKAGIKGGKASAAVRVKRSKDEIQLYKLIVDLIPDSLSNHIIADG